VDRLDCVQPLPDAAGERNDAFAERVAGHFDQLLLVGPAALTADGGEFNQDAAMLSLRDTVPSARSSTAKVRPVIDRPQVLARDPGDVSTAAEAART
jgi:hypothetical protein